jgi:hypothetical protein
VSSQTHADPRGRQFLDLTASGRSPPIYHLAEAALPLTVHIAVNYPPGLRLTVFAFSPVLHSRNPSLAQPIIQPQHFQMFTSNSSKIELDNIGPPRWNVAIETLSDDVLLENFDICLDEDEEIDPWYSLVHVCQRWR